MRYASPDPREAYLLHNSPRWGLPLEGAPPTRARTRWHAASTCSDDCVPPAASACTRAPLASPRGPPIPELARWANPSGVARHTRLRTLRSPGGPRACVWPPRRRRGRRPSRRSEWWGCTSTFSCPPFPKGRSHLCTRCYESETVAGGQAALHVPLCTLLPRREIPGSPYAGSCIAPVQHL